MNAYHGEFRETAYCWDLFLVLKALSSKKPFNGPMFSGAKKRWTCFIEPVGALLGLKGDDGRWQRQCVYFDRQTVDA